MKLGHALVWNGKTFSRPTLGGVCSDNRHLIAGRRDLIKRNGASDL